MLKITIDGGMRSRGVNRLFALFLLLATSQAQAHVKWFVDAPESRSLPAPDLGTITVAFIFFLAGLLLAKLVDSVARQYALTPNRLLSESTRPLRLVYYLIAVYFLGAAFSSTFLAPHIHVSEPLVYFGVAVQLLIYTLLLLDRGRTVCAALVALLFITAGIADPVFVLEYPLLLALAWIILYADERPNRTGLLVVRSLLGVSLITLAFTEKLKDPTMALALLEQHNFNFMAQLGFNYSDRLFVYSAGVVELLLGFVLLVGWVTRLAIAALFVFMVSTNAYFVLVGAYRMALVEAIGHLPIFACGILLLFYHPTAAVARAQVPLNLRGGRATESTALGRLR